MSDELKRRTPDEMKDLIDESARGLGGSVDGPLEQASVSASFLTGIREALELFSLDPAQGQALLDRIRQDDARATDGTGKPLFDMVQSANELAYDVPINYMPREEIQEGNDRVRAFFGKPPRKPKSIEWN